MKGGRPREFNVALGTEALSAVRKVSRCGVLWGPRTSSKSVEQLWKGEGWKGWPLRPEKARAVSRMVKILTNFFSLSLVFLLLNTHNPIAFMVSGRESCHRKQSKGLCISKAWIRTEFST